MESTVATLRLFGDDLIPEDITALLGAAPKRAWRKGEARRVSPAGRVYTGKTGTWLLSVDERSPGDLDAQVFELLGRLTDDLSVWRALRRYEPDLFCGLFMRSYNDGAGLSANVLSMLAERGIALNLDIYGVICERDEEPSWRPL